MAKKINLAKNRPGFEKIVSTGNLVDSPTGRVGESFFDYEYLCEFEAKIGLARNVV
jgi:hypothetical protein